MVVEAAECLGGNGYVEESGLPRLVRESPLNSIWEGAGNVQALDVVRALRREPRALDAYLVEIGRTRGADHRLDAAAKGLLTELGDLEGVEGRARRLAERLALVLQGSLLVRYAPAEVADAFCGGAAGRGRRGGVRDAAVDAGAGGCGGAGPAGGVGGRGAVRGPWGGTRRRRGPHREPSGDGRGAKGREARAPECGRAAGRGAARGWCCADTAPPPPLRPP
ncbi:hypothetical protein GCM10020256_13820 [Streptomyces thermocoprophilus]